MAGLAVTVVSPRHGSSLRGKLDALGYGFFVPIFFIHAGATLDLGAVFDSTESLILVPALLLVASGKAHSFVAGTGSGLGDSSRIGRWFAAQRESLPRPRSRSDCGRPGCDRRRLARRPVAHGFVDHRACPLMFSTIAGRAPDQEDGHTLIVGGGDLARTLVERLMAGGRRVVVLDRAPDASTKWGAVGVEGVVGDPLDALTLISIRLLQTEVAVVVDFDDPEQVVDYTRSMRRIHPTLRVVTWTSDVDSQFEHMDIEPIRCPTLRPWPSKKPSCVLDCTLPAATRSPDSWKLKCSIESSIARRSWRSILKVMYVSLS